MTGRARRREKAHGQQITDRGYPLEIRKWKLAGKQQENSFSRRDAEAQSEKYKIEKQVPGEK